MKQRILWKYEDNTINSMPPNVFIKKWMPQNDILAHPNVKLFISHGGLFSTMESIDRGIPLLIIPFFADQHKNGRRVEHSGYGKVLEFDDLTQVRLTQVINELLLSNQYYDRARELQLKWKDNLVHPMEEFIWWVEHVVKFKGANHLKSNAIHLSWISYLLIDVFLVIFIALFAICYSIYFLAKKLCCAKKDRTDQVKKLK